MKQIFIAFFLFSCTAVIAQNGFTKVSSWNEIFSKARQENKMVLIDCYFEGCHPCKQMDDEVLPLPAVSSLIQQNFIGIKTDYLKEELGKRLQMKYGIMGFPTYLILNKEGQLIQSFAGYQEADKFIKLLNNARALDSSDKTLNGFSPSLEVAYPEPYTVFFGERKQMAPDFLENLLNNATDKFSEHVIMPVLIARSLPSSLEDFVLNNYDRLAAMYGHDLVYAQRMRIVDKMIAKSPTGDTQWIETFMQRMKTCCSDEDWPYLRLDIAEAYYYNHLKDPKSFFRYAASHFNADDNKVRYMGMRMTQPGADREAVTLYIQWMKKVLDKYSSQDALMSAAYLLIQQDDKRSARVYAHWALQKAQLNHRDTSAIEEVLKRIDA